MALCFTKAILTETISFCVNLKHGVLLVHNILNLYGCVEVCLFYSRFFAKLSCVLSNIDALLFLLAT